MQADGCRLGGSNTKSRLAPCGLIAGVKRVAQAFLRHPVGITHRRIAVGIRENEVRMGLMGYNVAARKTMLFAIGAAIAGLAGALFANWGEIVTPNLFSLGQSAEIIIWCIVGGLGTRFGPIVGAAGSNNSTLTAKLS